MRTAPFVLSMMAACPSAVVLAFAPDPAASPQRRHRQLVDLSLSAAVTVSDANNEAASVQVYDNVFSPQACDAISSLALEHNKRANGSSSMFYRSSQRSAASYTALECAIDSALGAVGDDSEVVEYWSRHEYVNIDAHSDIDEKSLLSKRGEMRCPDWGHVAYLRIGQPSPTVVLPDRRKGWRAHNDDDKNNCDDAEGVRLVTIPAVVGRILRFDGGAMHAVPKPADRWLMSNVDEMILCQKEDDKGDVRAVLLFNTWNKTPPMCVEADPLLGKELKESTNGLMGKKKKQRNSDTLNGNDIQALLAKDPSELNSKQRRIIRRHREREGNNKDAATETKTTTDNTSSNTASIWEQAKDRVRCNVPHTWEKVPILLGDEQHGASGAAESGASSVGANHVSIRLMGNKQRRRHPKPKAHLVVKSADRLRNASYDAKNPTSFVLSEL